MCQQFEVWVVKRLHIVSLVCVCMPVGVDQCVHPRSGCELYPYTLTLSFFDFSSASEMAVVFFSLRIHIPRGDEFPPGTSRTGELPCLRDCRLRHTVTVNAVFCLPLVFNPKQSPKGGAGKGGYCDVLQLLLLLTNMRGLTLCMTLHSPATPGGIGVVSFFLLSHLRTYM